MEKLQNIRLSSKTNSLFEKSYIESSGLISNICCLTDICVTCYIRVTVFQETKVNKSYLEGIKRSSQPIRPIFFWQTKLVVPG